ncbi:MAG: hypothetical protein JWO31_3584 [Phycisphaerales bacterium]|nr:hypothetical protein [Phycisphaerales bacterium]
MTATVKSALAHAAKRVVSRRSALSAALAVAGLSGCQQEAPVTGRAETYDYPWLTVGSTDLRANTRVGDAKRTRDESGILYVSVPVRNTSDKQLYVDYRVTFVDRDGRQLSEYRNTSAIPPFSIRDLQANSTSRQADAFRVELTYPRVN